MANEFKIKRGDGAPNNGSIENYELVYDYANNDLWTKHGGQVYKVAGGNVGTVTNVVAGNGLTGGGTSTATLDLDFSELTDMTGDISGTTEFILQNGTVESRKAASEIKLSAFNNDLSLSSGTVTSVTAGTGATQSGTDTVNPTINVVGENGLVASANAIGLDISTLSAVGANNLQDEDLFAVEIAVGGAIKKLSASSLKTYVGSGAVSAVANGANDRIATFTSSDAIRGEGNLTFNGSTLAVSGAISTTSTITAGGVLSLQSELDFSGNGNKVIDVFTLANSNTFTIRHHNPSGNLFENALQMTANAGAAIFHNNSSRLETTSNGVTVRGNAGLLTLIGTDHSYIQFYPDGSAGGRKAYIGQGSSGSDSLYIWNEASDADIFFGIKDGSTGITALKIDGSDVGRVVLGNDNQKLSIGADYDLNFYNNGSASYIANSNQTFYLTQSAAAALYLRNTSSDQDIYLSVNDGGSQINAIQIDGSDAGTAIFNHDIKIPLAGRLYFGASDHTYISEDADDRLRFFVGGSEMMRFTESGSDTTLFYIDDAERVKINEAGLKVSSGAIGVNTTPLSDNGSIIASNDIIAGHGGGSVAMTINDGGGNANLTFNHRNKLPDQDGNSGRIEVNVDATSGAYMAFEIASNVTDGTSVSTSERLRIDDDGVDTIGNVLTGQDPNPTLEIRNTATSAGSGPSLIFGHSQSGTTSVGKINTYLTDGSEAGRSGHLDFYNSQGGTMYRRFRIDVDGSIIMNAAEKFYLDGKSDTYIHESSGDVLDFVVGGQQMLRMYEGGTDYVHVDDNTRLGVGNDPDLYMYHTSGASYVKNVTGMLSFQQTAQDQDIRFSVNDGGSTSNILTLNAASSRVGIGTTAPGELLHVAGTTKISSTGNTTLFIDGAGDGYTSGCIVFQGSDDDASYRGTGMYHHDAASDIEYYTGTLYANDAWAVTRKTSTASHDGSIAQGSHALFIIEGGGDVGIGTSNPTDKLHIKDATDISMSSSGNGQLRVEGNGYSGGIALDGSAMHIYHNSSSRNLVLGTNETARYQIDGSGNHSIYGNTSFSSPMSVQYGVIINEGGHNSDTRIEGDTDTNLVRVDAGTDRVGIGTGTPSGKLHVVDSDGGVLAKFQDSDSSHGGIIIACDTNGGHVGNSGGYAGEGIYFQDSAEVMRFYTAGSERMRLDNVGKLSIGSTTAQGAKLRLYGVNAGNWNDGLIIDDPSGWAATIYKRDNSPKMFQGLYSGNDNFIWMSSNYSNTSGLYGVSAPRTDAVLMARPGTDDLQIYLETQFGNKVGIGEDDIDANLHISGSPVVLKMERPGVRALRMGVADNSSDFIFADSDDLKSSVRMKLTGAGDVYIENELGIGTASPNAKLDLSANTSTTSDGDGTATMTLSGQDSILLEGHNGGASGTNYGSICWAGGSRRRAMITSVADGSTDTDIIGLSFYTQGTDGSGDFYESFRLRHNGEAHFDKDVVAFSSTPSDIRLKDNFEKIDNGLDVVTKLDGHTFNWKKDDKRLSAGFKAQEVEKILPHLVDEKKLPLKSDDEKEYKTLRYEELIPYLVEAIKEQQVQIDELKTKLGE